MTINSAADLPQEAVTAGMSALIARYGETDAQGEEHLERDVRDVLAAALPLIEWPPMSLFEAGLSAGRRARQLERLASDLLTLFVPTHHQDRMTIPLGWIDADQIKAWWKIQRGEIPPDA